MRQERKNMRFRKIIAVSSAVAGLTFVFSESAQAADAVFGDRVRLQVSANIPSRCGISEAPVVPNIIHDVTRRTSIEMPFKVDCNQPFVMSLTSKNGGFRAEGGVNQFGFLGFTTYNVDLKLGLNDDSVVTRSCGSASLNPASAASSGEFVGLGCDFYNTDRRSGLSSGNAIATAESANSSLKISWSDASASRRMIAGSYQDTLTIVVEPRS